MWVVDELGVVAAEQRSVEVSLLRWVLFRCAVTRLSDVVSSVRLLYALGCRSMSNWFSGALIAPILRRCRLERVVKNGTQAHLCVSAAIDSPDFSVLGCRRWIAVLYRG